MGWFLYTILDLYINSNQPKGIPFELPKRVNTKLSFTCSKSKKKNKQTKKKQLEKGVKYFTTFSSVSVSSIVLQKEKISEFIMNVGGLQSSLSDGYYLCKQSCFAHSANGIIRFHISD